MFKLFRKIGKSKLYIIITILIFLANFTTIWYFLYRDFTLLHICLTLFLGFWLAFFEVLFIEKRKIWIVAIMVLLTIFLPKISLVRDFASFQPVSRTELTSYSDFYDLGKTTADKTYEIGSFYYSQFVKINDNTFNGIVYINGASNELCSVDFETHKFKSFPLDSTNNLSYEMYYSYGTIYIIIHDSDAPGSVKVQSYMAYNIDTNYAEKIFNGTFKFFFSSDKRLLFNTLNGQLLSINNYLVATKIATFNGSNGSYDLTAFSDINDIAYENNQLVVGTDTNMLVFDTNQTLTKTIPYDYSANSIYFMQIDGNLAVVYSLGSGVNRIEYFNKYIQLEKDILYVFPTEDKVLFASNTDYSFFCFPNGMYLYYNYYQSSPIINMDTYDNFNMTYAFTNNLGLYTFIVEPVAPDENHLYAVNLGSFRYNHFLDSVFYGQGDPNNYFKGTFFLTVSLEIIYFIVVLGGQFAVNKLVNPVKDMTTKEYYRKHFNSK